jgi:hypothetical protein
MLSVCNIVHPGVQGPAQVFFLATKRLPLGTKSASIPHGLGFKVLEELRTVMSMRKTRASEQLSIFTDNVSEAPQHAPLRFSCTSAVPE